MIEHYNFTPKPVNAPKFWFEDFKNNKSLEGVGNNILLFDCIRVCLATYM